MNDLQDIVDKYKLGHRYFVNLDFDKGKLVGLLLSDLTFEYCCLSVDFSNSDFSKSKFINCNLKHCSFSNCNLSDSVFENCSVEFVDFKGAITKGVSFVNCSCYGHNVKLDEITNEFIGNKHVLVKELYDSIPEFIEMIDHTYDEQAYFVYGQLSLKLVGDIINNSEITDFTKRCFQLFNNLGDRNDNEIDNLLIVGIYEGLYSNKLCNEIARQLLIGRNKEVYEHWMINGGIRSDY